MQSFAFSELYSNQPKSEINPKMPIFEQLKKQVPVDFSKDAILGSVPSISSEVLAYSIKGSIQPLYTLVPFAFLS